MYSIAAKCNGAIPVASPEYDFKTDIHSILSSISSRTKVILIALFISVGQIMGRKFMQKQL